MIRRTLLFAAVLVASFAVAQDNTPPTAKLQMPASVKPGSAVKATLLLTFQEGLHGYQNPPSKDYMIPVTVQSVSGPFTLKGATYPKGKKMTVTGESEPVGVYEGTIKIPVTLQAPKKAGKSTVKLVVRYQQCNEDACFPPGTVEATASVTVKAK